MTDEPFPRNSVEYMALMIVGYATRVDVLEKEVKRITEELNELRKDIEKDTEK